MTGPDHPRRIDAEDQHAERFTLLRPLLFTIAYEILGSATDADDVLQDSYLRWAEVDLAQVRDTKSYLAQLVTRQALNALRAAGRRREDYVGPWLPEPLLVDRQQTAADAAEDVLLAESVSMAMLVVLETLSPDERAVFVLHDVFGFEHAEIASAIGKSAAAVRQLAHRARSHVQSRRRRFEPVDAAMSAELVTSFFAAAATGDVQTLMAMLAPDVVWTADSDGKASAARRPVRGAEQVARLVVGLVRLGGPGARVEPAMYNGAPAFVLYLDDRLEGVVTVELTDGLITNFYVMRNPEKLGGVLVPRPIGR
ncbi:MAG: RNA polymerase sigma-70 factor [Mycolicibacterium sp.]|jgi:RNA polymerase sigma-70 factor (ECF subfamily)|uniref:RNA polymerase subunit sigma-24 n=1 Tax=Mycolicibacterium insubricum TaxID=444597 RepID=A0A1X0DLS6_9MYCO|nr:RNA polymerase sigma-70 factor [Mycolicibacterium insubricum]MCB9441955.1 RNA polymerase sigma-70 factor [Mycolicibacterium sp.]ORA73112.1 RNA polymerase subunit sigma-24 [Mycolicibacterium insubricum]